ncbi:Mrr restriction system protein [Alphaproteobacteria bacterium SO-S41]|nr:Mrr restriction system protein [Alphaproteobacteria bacterium SO-S41]
MTIPDYQTLMLPLLRISAEGETRIPDIEGRIADEFSLTLSERDELLPSGRQKILHNRIHWSKFYLARAGLIDQPSRGRFVISQAGRELLSKNPTRIDNRLLMTIPAFQEFYQSSRTSSTDNTRVASEPALDVLETTTPEEQIESASQALSTALGVELLERIRNNSPSFFEQVIVSLLVGMGYGGSHRNAAQQLGRSGDGGVDGVINEDVLGLDRVYVQAKRYAEGSTVGRPEVQAFVGSLVGLGATKGVFVTTSSFSGHAIEYARHLSQRVVLIDGLRLTALMMQHGVGVRVTRTIEFKRVDEDFFNEEE